MKVITSLYTILVITLLAGTVLAQDKTASSQAAIGVVEFHVSPTGAVPFSSTDPMLGVPLPTTAGA